MGTDTSIEHDSALVRVYAQIYGSHSDGIDIFIAYFLRSATDGNLDFGPKRQNLLDIVKREENIYQEKE